MKATKYLALSTLTLLAMATISATTASAADTEYKSEGSVTFIPNTDKTDPVDPENPDPNTPVDPVDPDGTDPEPGTAGPLSIDFASSFDFGKNKISSNDETYYARAQKYKADASGAAHSESPNYVQVSDHRGTNGGWTLTVTQMGDFKAAKATTNDTLTGAAISLTEPEAASNTTGVTKPDVKDNITLVPNAESLVMSAKTQAGAGTWVDRWGKVESIDETDEKGQTTSVPVTKAVSLAVPGATPKDAVQYTTTLDWKLTDVPGN